MKTRNLILLLVVTFIAGFFLHPLILPCKDSISGSDTIIVEKFTRDTIIQEMPVPYKITQIDTIYQPKEVTVYKLKQMPVDTMMIIAEWNKSREYSDTLADNNDVFIHLSEKVAYNRLYDRKLIYETRCKDKIITNTVIPSGIYFLGGIGASREAISMSMGILYQPKAKSMYGLRIGYLQNPYFELQYGIKF